MGINKRRKVWYLLLLMSMVLTLYACGESKSEEENVSEVSPDTTEIIENDDEVEQMDWVANLDAAEYHNQLIVVIANGNTATVSLHEKNDVGIWREVLSTEAYIGKNGIGKTKEGDGKTPTGAYQFTFAFGIKENPGTNLEYVEVDDSYYWVDDSNSKYYNQFVSTKDVEKDWDSAEHILSAEDSYHYVLATDYNAECKPGVGSAIFMHCTPTGGAGCIAVPEEIMIAILKKITPDCVLIIDDETNIYSY